MKTLFPILILALATIESRSQPYQLTDLGATIGSNSYAQGINNQGQVVGYWDTTNGAHAFMYADGVVTDLGVLGANSGNNYALSINNAGQIVGFNQMTNGAIAFLFQNGTMTPLGKMGGLGSYAFGINNNGQIVGYVDTTNGARAMLYNGGNAINIGTLGGTNSYAYGINNSMQVAGSSLLSDNTTAHAFVWQAGVISDLNQLSPDNSNWQLSDAHGINDGGDIAGWGTINNSEHAFVLSGSGVVTDLGILPGGTNSYALGLNNSNQVVGASSSTFGNRAVVWKSGVANDLNNFIDASGWDLREASGVNDHGQIVGWGILNGQEHAFLLTPLISVKTAAATRSTEATSPRELLSSGTLTVTITNPVNNTSFPAPTNLTLTATTTDTGGTVTQVAFYIGGAKLLGVVTNSPYSMVWSNATVGIHAFTTVAMDNVAQVATSSIVTVSITTNLLPIADAHVRDGSSTNLNFGTTNLMECLTTATNGNSRDIYFKFDLTGISNVSSAQLCIFGSIPSTNSISNTVYSVTNTIWTETSITWSNKPTRVAALATNSVTRTNWFSYDISSHVKSQLVAGNTLVSVALHDPTNYSLLFRVNSKENTTNKPVLVIVITNNPISVSITNPANNSIFAPGSVVNLAANATDTDGVITQVQFFSGTNLLGTSTSTPYVLSLTNLAMGVYSVTAQATDNNGQMAISAPLTVYVTPLTNMVAWWRAEGNALDSVNTNHGTLQGGAVYTNGVVGQTFGFDGGSGGMFVNALGGLSVGGAPHTIEGWIKITALPSNRSWMLLLGPEGSGAHHWLLTSSGMAQLGVWGGTPLTPNLPVGVWVHLATTFDGSIYTCYTNGVFQSSRSLGFNFPASPPLTLGLPHIGEQAFNGMMDDFSIYNRALSANEIASIYNYNSNGKIPSFSISLTNPVNGVVFPAGSNINLGAIASDQNGIVTQVNFLEGTNVLKTLTNAPFTMTWNNVTAGAYALTAQAMNTLGLSTTSAVVNIIVDLPPSVTLTNPVNNAVIPVGSDVPLGASVTDADDAITQVQLFRGTNSLGIISSPPYNLIWTNVTSGVYALTAVAKDNYGLSTTSPAVNVTVEIPPVVSIIAPQNNSTLVSTQTDVTVTATATDPDGSINQVQFFQGATSLGVVTNAPFSLIWSNVVPGNYTLTAVAVDNLGLTTMSSKVSLFVTPFSIFITNPPNNSVFGTGPTNLTFNAVANDVIGSVTQVQYFQAGTNLGGATNPPYSLTWSNIAAGNYGLVAIATDNNGNTATSPVVNLTVSSLFAPNNLALWLKADALVGLTNNAKVPMWPDTSGWTNSATQSSIDGQPFYITNILGDRPVVRFTGVQAMTLAAGLSSQMIAANQGEAVVVLKSSVPAGSQCGLWMNSVNAQDSAYPSTDGSIHEGFGTTTAWPFTRSIMPTQPLTQYHVYEVCAQNNSWGVWINGQLQYQTYNNTFYFGGNPMTLGYSWNGNFVGDIAEVLFFKHALTDSERMSVNIYLNAKYSLMPTMPATPTNLVARAIATTQAELTWVESFDGFATQISVERSTASNGLFTAVAQLTGATSFVDTNLTGGITYYYRVRAINTTQWSIYSGIAQVTMPTNGVGVPFDSLALWLKADGGAIQATPNTRFNLWGDQSGNSNNAIQMVPASQPYWVPGVIGDRPVVRFDGTNDQLMLAAYPATNNFTVFAVARTSVGEEIDGEDNSYYAGGGYSGQHYLFGGVFQHEIYGEVGLSLGTNGVSAYEYGYNSYGQNHWGSLSVYNGTVGSGFSIIGMSYNNQVPSLFLNGVLVHTGIPSSRPQSVMSRAIGYGNADSTQEPFVGDVAEILIFKRTLTTDERSSVEFYLNAKYAVTPVVPVAPTSLVANTVSSNQIALVWSSQATNATCFKVERRQGGSGGYQQIAIVNRDTTAYLDTGLAAGTQYYYRLSASNLAGDSGYSNEAGALTSTGMTSLPLADLQVWLEADVSVNVNGDGSGQVNLWYDQSSHANNAAQGLSSQQPAFITNVINGRPVVRFDGTNDQLMLANYPATNNFTVFAVARTAIGEEIDAEDNSYYSGGGYSGQHYLFGGVFQHQAYGEVGLSLGTNGVSAYEYAYNDYGQNHFASLSVYNGVVGSAFSIIGMSYNNQVPSLFLNGVLVHTGILSSRPQSVMSRAIGYGNADSTQEPFAGEVAEIMVFNRTLTTDEIRTVGSYLNQKYNLVSVTNTPTAPTSLTATVISQTQIGLTWSNTTSVISEVQIERRTDVSGTYSVIGVVAQNTTNYVDISFSSGHVYFYRVRASNLGGGSPYSNEESVTVNTPPTVSVTTPTNGTIYLSPANVSLNASAVDSDGVVTNVTYFSAGTNTLGSASNAPFSLTWSNVLSGVYSLSATATDNLGGTSNSVPVSIIVSNSLPTVTLTAPTNTQFYFAPAVINLTAFASDANGLISRVDYFYNSTIKIGSSTTSPYPVAWTNLTTGNYPLIAVAVDNEGGMATSGVVNITVTNTPPTVSLASPTNSTLYQAPATIPMTANAGDVNGYVVKVEYFYAVTNKIGESTVSPFKVFWNNVSAGTNLITAKATDDGGATATSGSVSVIINAQPTVSITNPVNNATFTGPTNITINATASDSDGTISRVDFYYGINNFIGSDTNAPYSMVFSNALAGTYPLTVKATDNRGGTSTSGLVYVSVSSNMTDVADAYVRDGTFANTNYGSAATLIVQTNATSGSKYDTYLKFDTSRFSNVTAAKLNVYGAVSAKNNTVSVTVCGTGTNWTETGITWSNRPALGTIIRSTNFNGTTLSWYTFDVTGYVQAQKTAGTNVISLVLHATNTTSVTVNLNSKEAGSNAPYLQIFATNSPPTVSISSPTNNAVFTPSNNVTLSASATDSDGSINKLEFFQGATSLGVLTNGQTSLTWTNVPFGEYVLTAVATDNFGASTTSASVNFNADSAFNNLDPDGDGLTNIEEWLLGTNPQVNDTQVIGNGIIQIHTPLQ